MTAELLDRLRSGRRASEPAHDVADRVGSQPIASPQPHERGAAVLAALGEQVTSAHGREGREHDDAANRRRRRTAVFGKGVELIEDRRPMPTRPEAWFHRRPAATNHPRTASRADRPRCTESSRVSSRRLRWRRPRSDRGSPGNPGRRDRSAASCTRSNRAPGPSVPRTPAPPRDSAVRPDLRDGPAAVAGQVQGDRTELPPRVLRHRRCGS